MCCCRSIEKTIFPHQWKTAKICPIRKVSNPVKISDYRPISILPILSKVFERVILEQLCNFIGENSVYAKTQSGFNNDTTIYTSAKVSEINHSSNLIETDIDALKIWSRKRNLVFDADKTVTMLFSTPQMSRKHDLARRDTYTVNCEGKALERVKSWKIPGIHFDEYLLWSVHIDQLITSSYAKLKQIQKMIRYSPFKIRKNMAEALILMKIDYSVVILHSIPA